MNGKPCAFLFLHIFKFLCDSASQTRGRRVLRLKRTIHRFKPSLELSPFEDPFFLVTLVSSEAHATIYDVSNGVEGICSNLFSKYWIEVHFLLGNHFFVYNENNLSE